MFVGSAINEGLAGMQQSHKKMLQSAEQIVKVGVPTDGSAQHVGKSGEAPVTNHGTSTGDLNSTSTVNAAPESAQTNAGRSAKVDDIVEPLVELKKQQLLFDASAAVVKAGSETLGRLIDDLS